MWSHAVLHPLRLHQQSKWGTLLAHLQCAADTLFYPPARLSISLVGPPLINRRSRRPQNVMVHLLILISALPATMIASGCRIPLWSGKAITLCPTPNVRMRWVKTFVHHSFPQKRVVRHLVKLVPGKLRRHKIVDPRLLHDLGRGGITGEYVRKPQHPAIHAEFLLKEPFAIPKTGAPDSLRWLSYSRPPATCRPPAPSGLLLPSLNLLP